MGLDFELIVLNYFKFNSKHYSNDPLQFLNFQNPISDLKFCLKSTSL